MQANFIVYYVYVVFFSTQYGWYIFVLIFYISASSACLSGVAESIVNKM